MIADVYSNASSHSLSSEQAAVVRQLLALPTGWATAAEITCTIAPSDVVERGKVRRLLGDLVRADVVASIYARHHGHPMLILDVDHDALRALLAESSAA